MKPIAALSILSATVFGALFGVAHAAPAAYDPCLDYFKVGDSACSGGRPKPKTPTDPTVTVVIPPQPIAQPVSPAGPPTTLDGKIDDFITNHGKPPREFVAFYLDPTPENAMKWISKYNELLDRNTQIAVAWTQAETLYARELQKGVSPSALASSTLPPVPDFGIALPGFTDNPALVGNSLPGVTYTPLGGAPGMAPNNPNATSAIQSMLTSAAGLGGMPQPQVEQPFSAVRPLEADGRLGTPLVVVSRTALDAPVVIAKPDLNLTYYFSSVCPYCLKFTSELNQALEVVPDAKLSCVDVTSLVSSKESKPENAHAIPRCQWRLPNAGEINQNQVRQTPTLLIQWGAGQPQRINGFVEASRLRAALQSGGLLGQ